VHAREKSSPRECLGSEVAGLPVWLCDCMYEWMFVCSSCGLSGAAVESCAGLGICKLKPRERKSGRRVVLGVVGTALSSLLSRRSFSRKDGDGARAAGGSDRLRFFAGDLEGVLASKAGGKRLLTVFIVQNSEGTGGIVRALIQCAWMGTAMSASRIVVARSRR